MEKKPKYHTYFSIEFGKCNNFAFFFFTLRNVVLIVSCLLIRLIMNKSLHTSNRYIGVSFNHFKGGMSKYKYFMTNLAGPHRK